MAEEKLNRESASKIETETEATQGGAAVARRAHNPEAAGSNPAPATSKLERPDPDSNREESQEREREQAQARKQEQEQEREPEQEQEPEPEAKQAEPAREPPELPELLPGLYLVPPHGEWLARGEKTAIVKSKPFEGLEDWHLIVSDDRIWGVVRFLPPREIDLSEFSALEPQHKVSEREREEWWPEKERLYFWKVEEAWAYEKPIPYEVPKGVQTFIKAVPVPERPLRLSFALEPEEKAKLKRAVLGIIVDPKGERTLLLYRRNEPRVWSPPGGFLSGREPEEAILAEIEEETGLKPLPLGDLGIFEHRGTQLEVFAFLYESGEPRPSPEAKELRWFTQEELIQLAREGKLSPRLSFFERAFELAKQPQVKFTEVVRAPDQLTREELELVKRWLEALGFEKSKLYRRTRELLSLKAPSFRREEAKRLFDALPEEFVVVPKWVSITGGFIYARGRKPNDLDIVLRDPQPPTGAYLKLERALEEATKGELPLHFTAEASGPSWAFVPLYDLVARKRPEFELEEIPEEAFAARFYRSARGPEQIEEALGKAKLVTDWRKIRPGVPIRHYGVAGEYYSGEVELAWEKWARRALEKGVPGIVIEPKFDGFRFIVSYNKGELHVFSDKGYDRAHVFPGLEDAIRKLGHDLILDTEFVETDEEGQPIPRREMAWMGSAKEPKRAPVTIFIHDLVWLDGENLADRPYTERLALLKKLLPRPKKVGLYRLYPTPFRLVKTEKDFLEAVEWARKAAELSSEGAMAKWADFRYRPEPLASVLKIKNEIEVDCAIIGYRKVIPPKPAGKRLSREEALQHLKRELREGKTYNLRLALKDARTGKLIPIEADKRLTASDLKLTWDEERQRWKGTDDPKLWTMFPPFRDRPAGELAYGNSYSIRLDEPPRKGDVAVLTPAKVSPFKDEEGRWHISFQHPRVKQIKRKSPPGSIQATLRAFNLNPKDYGF